MSELFPSEATQSLSPRLQWMQRHGIFTEESRVLNCPPELRWTAMGEDIPYGFGATEEEALADLAQKHGIRLWNECGGGL